MKLTAPREALMGALQQVASAVAARSTKPILSNVKASASADGLTLAAYDTETGIRYRLVGLNVRESGGCILSIARLISILRESSDAEASIEGDDSGVKVRTGAGRYEMPGYPVEEFPDFPEWDAESRHFEAAAGDLRRMIRRTAFAADKKDSTRFALSGVLWEGDAKTLRLVATDSKRLAVCEGAATLRGEADKSKVSHLVPLKAMTLLERNLADDGETVRVALHNNDALFQTERATIYTRLIEGRFPPYRTIIDQCRKDAGTRVVLPRDSFLTHIRQAAIMTDEESKRIDMSFESGRIVMTSQGAESGSSEVVMLLPEYSGPSIAISFDPKYLTDFLRAIDSEPTVNLDMSDGSKPAMFSLGEECRFLVMPLSS